MGGGRSYAAVDIVVVARDRIRSSYIYPNVGCVSVIGDGDWEDFTYINISRTSAVSSTNVGSILIFASCVDLFAYKKLEEQRELTAVL